MKGRILVVDDEAATNFLIRQIFRGEIRNRDYELNFAENGQEALKIMQNDGGFDVVLADINMPHMDGLTLLAHITDEYPFTKVIMVSAYMDMEKIRKSMNFGAYDFVNKPIEAEDLRDTVKRALDMINRKRPKF